MVATLYHGVVRRVRASGDQGDSMGSRGASCLSCEVLEHVRMEVCVFKCFVTGIGIGEY
jgi:hypothetical protein